MNFKHGKARQAEIIKTVQKDEFYTINLSEDLSDLLRFIAGPRIWIRYNNLCKFLAEIVYHGFASVNRLQTLGEEYTGIIQVDSNFVSLPNKIIQLSAIILESCGETLYLNVLKKFEKDLKSNQELTPEAKELLLKIISIMKFSIPYIKGFHKTWFYINSSKYHISKRLLGVNYVLVRKWLHPNQSLYGFRILGFLTFFQLIISLFLNIKKALAEKSMLNKINSCRSFMSDEEATIIKENTTEQKWICNLCLETRQNTSVTLCGHLFCWECIIEWLDERNECPICREVLKKSNVTQLANYR